MKKLIIPEFSEGNTVILNTFFFLLHNKAIAKKMKQFNFKQKKYFLKTDYKYNFRDMY